ncbi:MAG: hypothetical protein PHE32_02305 [Candidatus Shapirobacteria bacterium]|nr:hypothetical protein [Candidatus Shapirobacteria bacterium]MDD4410503.1 hypothetical protein [Candidatus Shapirobacteria bacterium]
MKDFVNRFSFVLSMFVCVVVYLCLAFKNPFVPNSLVSNLEPYPDTLWYSVPAWNFVNNNGFSMSVFGVEIKKMVPPAYSIYLIPFFAIFKDVRSFYFGNLLLGILSIILFGLIAKKIFKNNSLLILFLEFLLITNFYFYILPSLLMAENLTLFVTLCAVYILISKMSIKNTFFAGFVGILFWLIKFSNLTLGLSFLFLYTIKIVLENKTRSDKIKHISILVFFGILFFLYLKFSSLLAGRAGTGSIVAFSKKYFIDNFKYYINTFFGGKTSYSWYQQIFLNKYLGILSLIGFILGLWNKNTRKFTVSLFLIVFPLVIFMSFFYSPSSRYVFAVLPLLILLIGIFLDKLGSRISKKKFFVLVFLIAGVYLLSSQYSDKNEFLIVSLKKQIGLNFRHKEDPWNYLAIQSFNGYFKEKKENVYLATFLPPFYINYFMNENYKFLPIFLGQEFSDNYLKRVYKSDLIGEYKKLLEQNNELYFSNYYVNNSFDSWNMELEKIKTNFEVKKVSDGCLGSCNIYRINLKNKL